MLRLSRHELIRKRKNWKTKRWLEFVRSREELSD